MKDWLVNAFCVAALFLGLIVLATIRIGDIVNDCQKMQSFRFGDKVYDCKERGKP